ncbi:von Willebrand factor A domain-containing protein 7 [Hippocampus zosterae]|uniref:von Willebrand factor A domain-containing protein 7 n=1 Tax=Hippocampus zosterae TaxID=109293 RepID=UPI00223CFEA5|nr:von Willebrand factor A domain-containing protein 7 [Hippocampus zosterae]XP_051939214.1 von Willebrand factor A domain-containing protein 7 [Hippocampus zosterae]
MTSGLGFSLLALILSGPTAAFVPIGGGVSTHVSITGTALLQKVTETCRAVAEAAGHEFKPTGSSPGELVQACLGPTATGEVSGVKFYSALQEIYTQNGLVDRNFANSAPHHFNSEAFLEGRSLITKGMASIKANIRTENFKAARETMGRVLHTLQDFYSHSNWVELGNTEPYIALIRPDLPLENMADVDTATCRDCATTTCTNPILQNILNQRMLTSGYMGIFSDRKPQGKCSHGGEADLSSATLPRGGIHKDELRTDNAAFHNAAVNAATAASLQLLEDVRLTVGNNDFLRLMGITRSAVVCFVIDDTGSMSDDIEEARKAVYKIIDSKKGTQDEPSEYILVTFNDPHFGPLFRTTDPDKMKTEISKIKASGGGDHPEMCFSGLQLALTGAPASSHIYVFTDAPPKDIHLKNTIAALIKRTKSTVSFYITAPVRRHRRSVRAASFKDYKDLALASGGQAIQVSKSQLAQATNVILDTSTSALVTVFQSTRDPGKPETFPFMLDKSLQNVTIYITGQTLAFTLTNPAGVNQSNIEPIGALAHIQTVGNLRRIVLNSDHQSGSWKININSKQPYTIKVTGQSTITFIYDFVESFKGPHPGYAVLSGLPQAGQPATLMLSVMGRRGTSSIRVENVALVVSDTGVESNGKTTDMGNGDILVTVDEVPAGEFVVILKGTDEMSSSSFQRQSTTQLSVSKVNIQAMVDTSVEPGKDFNLSFSVMTKGPSGKFIISGSNDRDFPMSYPKSLSLTTGTYTNGTLTISPPSNTPSGTDVTLTLEAKSSNGVDSNHAVLRLSVVTKITDFVQPVCDVVSVWPDDCPRDMSQCMFFEWELSANLTDGNGTGIERVSLRQGDGTLSYTSLNVSSVHASYNASCCSQIVEFVAIDKVGNVGKCYHSIVRSAGHAAFSLSTPLWLCLLMSAWILKT